VLHGQAASLPALDDIASLIGGAVVADYDLPRRDFLARESFEDKIESPWPIVGRNDHCRVGSGIRATGIRGSVLHGSSSILFGIVLIASAEV
jgi:hypothetical protein